jgi:hypothetical protein
MKMESLVIENKDVSVNMVWSLVHTARHALGVGYFVITFFIKLIV